MPRISGLGRLRPWAWPWPWLLPALLILFAGLALAAGPAETIELDLPTVAGLALAGDPGVLTAQAGVETARAAVAAELARIAPGCSVTAGYGRSPAGGGTSVEGGSIVFTISQSRPGLLPRLIGGKAANAVSVALWEQADAEARLAQARVAAVAGAAQKYLAAVKAKTQVDLCRQALDLAAEDERVAEANLKAGLALKLDVARAGNNRARAALNLRQAEADCRNALDAMLLQIGRPIGANVKLAPGPAAGDGSPGAEEDLYAEALKARADAIIARTGVRKAENAVILAGNSFLPDLKLSAVERQGGYAVTVGLDLTTGDLFWSAGGEWTYGTSLVPPVTKPDGLSFELTFDLTPFDGGLRRARLNEARAALESAKISRYQIEGNIRLELRQRLTDLELAFLRLSQAGREKDLAEQARKVAMARYREGIALYTELGEATQALAEAELGLVQAQYELLLARVRLDQACGLMPGLEP